MIVSCLFHRRLFFFFFFNDTATTEIYTLSLHDALPILPKTPSFARPSITSGGISAFRSIAAGSRWASKNARSSFSERSEEHTSELQSRPHLVCRLLLEKKKKKLKYTNNTL